MNIIIPEQVTESKLVSSSVPLTDFDEYDSGQAYNTGDTVRVGIVAYESLTDGNTDDPGAGILKTPPTWLRLGYVNRWRMFHDGPDSPTSYEGDIVTVLTMDKIVSALALLGLVGLSVHVEVEDPIEGVVYDETRQIVDPNVGNWWDFYFSSYEAVSDHVFDNLPQYLGAEIRITVERLTGGDSEVGRLIVGEDRKIGDTQMGVTTGIQAFTGRERDGFGNLTIVPRRSVRRADYNVVVDTASVPRIQQWLEGIASSPTVFIGDPGYGNTIVFGLYRDFSISISGLAWSTCSIDVEGF